MVTSANRGLRIDIRQTTPIPLDAQLTCAPRELLALVGASGSGKSTLLRAIAGIFKAQHCEVSVDDEIWSSSKSKIHIPTHKRQVGMVFQSYALFPHMTTLANVAAAVERSSKRERKEIATNLLAKVNLSGLESRRPHELSGGQQQRVAVARALAREPKVLLLDEPFTAVDKITRRRLYREIIKLRRELEIPVILVTHDLDEAAILADRMVVLHKGKTLQSGSPEDITTRPDSTELARLMDIRNVFTASIEGYDSALDRTRLTWAGTTILVKGDTQIANLEKIKWAIPDGSVVIQRTDRPSSGTVENSIECTVDDVLMAGHTAQLALKPHCDPTRSLYASVPSRIVRLNHIATGSIIKVSLQASDIHIMLK